MLYTMVVLTCYIACKYLLGLRWRISLPAVHPLLPQGHSLMLSRITRQGLCIAFVRITTPIPLLPLPSLSSPAPLTGRRAAG